jgi:hypothetical protein
MNEIFLLHSVQKEIYKILIFAIGKAGHFLRVAFTLRLFPRICSRGCLSFALANRWISNLTFCINSCYIRMCSIMYRIWATARQTNRNNRRKMCFLCGPRREKARCQATQGLTCIHNNMRRCFPWGPCRGVIGRRQPREVRIWRRINLWIEDFMCAIVQWDLECVI